MTQRPRDATRRPTIRPFVHAGRRKAARWVRRAAPNAGAAPAMADGIYLRLADATPWPRHPVLRWHIAGYLLPGVTVYRTLRQDGRASTDAAAVLARLLEADTGPRRRRLERLGRSRGFFPLLAVIVRFGTAVVYPRPGWRVHWRELSRRRIAFDIDRCYYLTTLTALGAPELTPAYCRVDDLLYQGVSPHLEWRRTSTLAEGCERCDFRYVRRKMPQA